MGFDPSEAHGRSTASGRLRRHARAAVTGALVCGALALPAGAARADVPSATVLQRLNAERARDGIPADVTERDAWSSACARHNAYERANGGALTHDEQPGAPGYSEEGAWAARMSVLSAGSDWDATNPFATAPIHRSQLLAPALAETGIDDSQRFVCVVTLAGRTRPVPSSDVIDTSPGDERTDVPVAERADEEPFVPGDFTQPPARGTTGPNILVFARGPSFADATPRIADATLSGPDGPVDVRWVDSTTATLGPYLPPGGVIVPAAPLRPGARYDARVSVSAGATTVRREWSFTTAAAAPAGKPVSGTGGGGGSAGGAATTTVPATGQDAAARLVHQRVTVRLKSRTRRRWLLTFHPDARLDGRRLIVTVKTTDAPTVRRRLWIRRGSALVVLRPRKARRVLVRVLGEPFIAADGTPVIVDATRRAFR